MMLVVASACALVLAVIVLVLAVPVAVRLTVEREERLESQWRVRWLFGLVEFGSRSGPPVKRARRPKAEKPGERDQKVATRGRGRGHVAMAALRIPGLGRRVVRLLRQVRRRITLVDFHVHAAIGIDDPAATGVLFGVVGPVAAMAAARGYDVDVRPMFQDHGVRGRLTAALRVRPLAVVATLVAFLLSPPVVRAGVAVWRARR